MLHKTVRTKNLNEPKRPETSQNDTKLANTTKKNCEATRNNPKFQNSDNFQLAFAFQSSSQSVQIWAFWVKKYQLSNLNKILPVLYFQDTDFKSDICFRKFLVQIPKFGHYGPKSINFQILAKSRICQISNLNKILSVPYFKGADFKFENCFRKFLAKIPKFEHFGPTNRLFNLSKIFPVRFFGGADLKLAINFL